MQKKAYSKEYGPGFNELADISIVLTKWNFLSKAEQEILFNKIDVLDESLIKVIEEHAIKNDGLIHRSNEAFENKENTISNSDDFERE